MQNTKLYLYGYHHDVYYILLLKDDIDQLFNENGLSNDSGLALDLISAWSYVSLAVVNGEWSAEFSLPGYVAGEDYTEPDTILVDNWTKVRCEIEIEGSFDRAKFAAEWQSRIFGEFEFTFCKITYDGKPLDFPWGYGGDIHHYYIDEQGQTTELDLSWEDMLHVRKTDLTPTRDIGPAADTLGSDG